MPLNRFVHFSDWVIGHSHLAMIGFASFIALGGLLHAWRLTPGCRYNPAAADWSFWLLAMGLAAMDLTAAGLVQGQLWHSDCAVDGSVRASAPFWWVRTVSGVVLLAGFLAVVVALLAPLVTPVSTPMADMDSAEQHGRRATLLQGRAAVRPSRLALPGVGATRQFPGLSAPDCAGICQRPSDTQ